MNNNQRCLGNNRQLDNKKSMKMTCNEQRKIRSQSDKSSNENLFTSINNSQVTFFNPVSRKYYLIAVVLFDAVFNILLDTNVANMHKYFSKKLGLIWQQIIICLTLLLIALVILAMHNQNRFNKLSDDNKDKWNQAIANENNPLTQVFRYITFGLVLIAFLIGLCIAKGNTFFHSIPKNDGVGIILIAFVTAGIVSLIYHNYFYYKIGQTTLEDDLLYDTQMINNHTNSFSSG